MDSLQERDSLIQAAMAAAVSAIPAAAADPRRPTYHYHAPAQWMNDPNGPIFYRGWYHVFYQFNPYGDHWGHMHWGHARSRDMVNWQQLPVALWPSKREGEEHVYSGSVAVDGSGRPLAFYTSIGNRDPEQWIAEPDDPDLLRWRKPAGDPLLTLAAHGGERIAEWRDPFLFTDGGAVYMVVGGGRDGRGVVLLYRANAPDLRSWKYLGVLFQHPDPDIANVECPNIVALDGQWLLLTSTHGKVESFVGGMDLSRPAFTVRRRGVLADGSYASQLFTGAGGECIHLAWMHTEAGHAWNGYLSLPSRLRIAPDGSVLRQPIPALTRLRRHSLHVKKEKLIAGLDLTGRISGTALEVVARIDPGTATAVSLDLGVSPDGRKARSVRYETASRTLVTDGRAPVVLPASASGAELDLHVFLDRGALDVYAGGGAVTQASFSADAALDAAGIRIVAEGGTATIQQLDIYAMAPAAFDMSRFHG